jgi:hypothetical protein
MLQKLWLIIITPITFFRKISTFLNEDVFKKILENQVYNKDILKDSNNNYYISYQNIINTYIKLESFRRYNKTEIIYLLSTLFVIGISIGFYKYSHTQDIVESFVIGMLASFIFFGAGFSGIIILYQRFFLSKKSQVMKLLHIPELLGYVGLSIDDNLNYLKYTVKNLPEHSKIHYIEDLNNTPKIRDIKNDIWNDGNEKALDYIEEIEEAFIDDNHQEIQKMISNFIFKNHLVKLDSSNITCIICFITIALLGLKIAEDKNAAID